MAESERAPKRASARTRAGARPVPRGAADPVIIIGEPVADAAADTAPVRLDGRRLSRRIEFTPRLVEHIRQRFEEAGEGPDVIARSVGVAKATIQRLAKEQAWTRAGEGPRDLPRAGQLAAEARALAAGGAAPVDVGEAIERLLRLVSAEIGVYENLRATLQNEPQAQREAQKTAHNIATLTSTLDTLRRMRAGQTVTVSDDTDDDLPADIDALRESLARRIEAFFAGRPDEGNAGEPEPAPAERA